MSWLARSLANSLRLDEEDDNLENAIVSDNVQSSTPRLGYALGNANFVSSSPEEEEEAHARGVKDDLTELGQTLTRQWRGVANFLAPPPDAVACAGGGSSFDLSKSGLNRSQPSNWSDSRVGSDSAEIVGRFRRFDTETMEMASDYHPFRSEGNEDREKGDEFEEEEETEEEEEEIDAVGVTDEVLAFARNIAMHPETWLDFPLDPDEDLDDFDMSDAQGGHALAIERLAPRLAALRIELCPCHMSVGYFWKVYFVLLHSRLHKNDAERLSSPQVMEARALWMKELQKQTNYETDISFVKESGDGRVEDSTPSSSNYYAPPEFLSPRIYAFEPPSIMSQHDHETVKHMSESTEAAFVDKAVIEEEQPVHKTDKRDTTSGQSPKARTLAYAGCDDEDDDWPEEEDSTCGGGSIRATIFAVNEEEVSFSDLEGDDDISSLALKCKTISNGAEGKTA